MESDGLPTQSLESGASARPINTRAAVWIVVTSFIVAFAAVYGIGPQSVPYAAVAWASVVWATGDEI